MNAKLRTALSASLILFSLTACKGGGGSSSSEADPPPPPPAPAERTSRVMLGPIIAATIDIYEREDVDFNNPITSSTTSEYSEGEGGGGYFGVNIEGIDSNEWVIVKVSGGTDIDADDNGQIDDQPTDVDGAVYALAPVSKIMSGGIIVNSLTDIIYQEISRENDLSAMDIDVLNSRVNEISEKLLNKENSTADYSDVLDYNPVLEKQMSSIPWTGMLSNYISAIHNGFPEDVRYSSYKQMLQNMVQEYPDNLKVEFDHIIDNDVISPVFYKEFLDGDSDYRTATSQQTTEHGVVLVNTVSNSETTHVSISTQMATGSVAIEYDYPGMANSRGDIFSLAKKGGYQPSLELNGNDYVLTIPKGLMLGGWSLTNPVITSGGEIVDVTVIEDDPIVSWPQASVQNILKRDFTCQTIPNNTQYTICDSNEISYIRMPRDEADDLADDFIDIVEFASGVSDGWTAVKIGVGVIVSSPVSLKSIAVGLLADAAVWGLNQTIGANEVFVVQDPSNIPSNLPNTVKNAIFRNEKYNVIGVVYGSRFMDTNWGMKLEIEPWAISSDQTLVINSQPHDTFYLEAEKEYGYLILWKTPLQVSSAPSAAQFNITLRGAPGSDDNLLIPYSSTTLEELADFNNGNLRNAHISATIDNISGGVPQDIYLEQALDLEEVDVFNVDNLGVKTTARFEYDDVNISGGHLPSLISEGEDVMFFDTFCGTNGDGEADSFVSFSTFTSGWNSNHTRRYKNLVSMISSRGINIIKCESLAKALQEKRFNVFASLIEEYGFNNYDYDGYVSDENNNIIKKYYGDVSNITLRFN